MTERLQQLLHELGEEQEPVRLEPSTYRRARRARRRGLVARGAAATVALAAVAVGLTEVPGPDRSAGPSQSTGAPALPSRVYDVPERLAPYPGDPTGWHESLRADTLAVGPTAVVFPVNQAAVAAVSAVDGRYHGLKLPGFDGDMYLRFSGSAAALSPDGTRLAYTWHPNVIGDVSSHDDDAVRSGVRVVDLTTGQVTSHRIPGGFGVFATGLSWSPDGRYLAYNVLVTTNSRGDVGGRRNLKVERLDTTTGQRVEVPLLGVAERAPAVSNRGEVAIVYDAGVRTWLPGRSPEKASIANTAASWTASWAGDGIRIAVGAARFTDPWAVRAGRIDDVRRWPVPANAEQDSQARVIGWVDDHQVAVLHRTPDQRVQLDMLVRSTQGRGSHTVTTLGLMAGASLEHVSLATGLLGQPTRDFPEPDWPFDWTSNRLWAGIGGVALLLTLAGAYTVRRLS